jgi:hypothetical protein
MSTKVRLFLGHVISVFVRLVQVRSGNSKLRQVRSS